PGWARAPGSWGSAARMATVAAGTSTRGRHRTRAARGGRRRAPDRRRAGQKAGAPTTSPTLLRASLDLPHAGVELDECGDHELRGLAVGLPLVVHQVCHLEARTERRG